MKLSDFSIARPVTTTMAMAALFVFGLIGYSRLGIDSLPNVDIPIVTITTLLPGASPEIVEENVTDVIEEAVSTIEGVKKLTSISSHTASIVTMEFELDRDIDIAAQDVRSRVSGVVRKLPDDAEYPNVSKVDTNERPVIWVATSGEKTIQEITDYAKNILKPRLETIQGVGSIRLGGKRERAIRVWFDRSKMEALSITASEVEHALKTENLDSPGGWLEGTDREFSVITKGEIETLLDLQNVIIASRGGVVVRLGDFSRIEDGLEDKRSLARFNGKPSVGLGIQKKPGSNTVEIAREIRKKVAEMQGEIPPGMNVTISFDSSIYIEQSVSEMNEAITLGALLAAFIVFCFLRTPTSTIIVCITIPLSIIATFFCIYFLGFSLNTMTMLGLTLAIGIVVDDSIIVLENIYRHRQLGEGKMEGASKGTTEIAFAAIASTLSIIAVFMPVAFMSGVQGRFFYEFGITVAVATAFSTFIALTLTPMLCARFLSVTPKENSFTNYTENLFIKVEKVYSHYLAKAMKNRLFVIIASFSLFFIGIGFAGMLDSEMVPKEDRSAIMVNFQTPIGSSIDYTDSKVKVNEEILLATPEIASFFTIISFGPNGTVNKGIMFVKLTSKDERDRSQDEVVAHLRKEFSKEPGIKSFVVGMSASFGGNRRGAPFSFVIKGPDMASLKKYATIIADEFEQIEGIIDVDTDYDLGVPELQVHINKEKAAELGVSVSDIAIALNSLIGGRDVTTFADKGERYNVKIKLEDKYTDSPSDIDSVFVKNAKGELIKLKSLVTVKEGVAPSVINRRDGRRSITISSSLDSGKTLGSAADDIEAIAARVLPEGFSTDFSGNAETMKESEGSMGFVFILALLVTYMVLASQFESFAHPFTVLMALPLATFGAFGSLLVTGNTMNIYSFIGIVLLIGIVTKNSIILVDYSNKLMQKGMNSMDAVLEAGPIRLRPVLMTALSTIFGVLPTALALGSGSETRAPMAIATIGGLVTSTFLTLFVIPIIYTYVDHWKTKFSKLFFDKLTNTSQ